MKRKITIFLMVLIISIIPLSANAFANKGSAFISPLTKCMKTTVIFSPTALNNVKGNVSERISDNYFQNLSKTSSGVTWRKANAKDVVQGIDHLFFKYENGEIKDCLIADSKYNTSRLSSPSGVRQLSYEWTKRTIKTQALPIVNNFIKDIETENVTIKHPSSITPIKGQKHYIDEKNYIWTDKNDKVHYTGKKNDLVKLNGEYESHVLKNLKVQKQMYEGIIDGKISPRLRIVQYNINGGNIIQTVKEVQYDLLNDNEVIVNKTLQSNTKPVSTFLNELNDEDYSTIKHKGTFPETLSLEDFKSNISTNDLTMIINNTKADQVKIAAIKKRLIKIDIKKNIITPSLKGATRSALLSFAMVFTLDAVNGNGMNWSQDFSQGTQGTLIGITYTVTDKVIERGITNGNFKFLTANVDDLAKTSTKATKGYSKTFAKKAYSKGLKISSKSLRYALPGVADFIIGMTVDEIILHRENYSPELTKAIRLRNLKVNGISSVAGITISVITSELGPVAFVIGGLVDVGTSIVAEYLLPQPDALNPAVLYAEYNENSHRVAVEKWFKISYAD